MEPRKITREKLRRMSHPECAEDYGISMSLSEIEGVEGGVDFLYDFFKESMSVADCLRGKRDGN